jgi:D-serine deaminase-like pyridoxal phosphate-dependent protein
VIDVDTPSVVIDVDRLQRNLTRWQRHCDEVGLVNRPHVKTHKSVEIATRTRRSRSSSVELPRTW